MQLIFLELALGVMLIGCIAAFRRPIGERVCYLVSVPLAFLIAFLITKGGAFDKLTDVAMSLLNSGDLAKIFESSAAASTGMAAIISSLVRPLFAVVAFWIIALILRIIINIVLKKTHLSEKCGFFAPTRGWKCLVSCFVGIVCCMIFSLLSYLPVAAVENIVEPTAEEFSKEEYEGTYVNHLVGVFNENFLPTAKGTGYGFLHRYTGIGSILDATVDGLSTHTIYDNSGNPVELNTAKVLRTLVFDGAKGMVVYEYACDTEESTLGTLSPVADIIKDLASFDALITIGVEVASEMIVTDNNDSNKDNEDVGTTEEAEGYVDVILGTASDTYLSGDVSAIKNDINVVANIVTVITEDLKDSKIRDNAFVDDLFKYFSDADCSVKVVSELSKLTMYEDVFDLFMELGINLICDALDLSHDKAEHYENFMNSVYEAANRREEGNFDMNDVSFFIDFVAECRMRPDEYVLNDPENYNQIDVGYIAYNRYMAKYSAFEEVFVGYGIDSQEKQTYFVSETFICYAYDSETGIWSRISGIPENIKISSFASELLAVKTAAVLDADNQYTITINDIKAYVGVILTAVDEFEGHIDSSYLENTRNVLNSLVSIDGFNANGAVYATEILAALKKDVGFNDSDNQSFAIIVSSAFNFLDQIMGEDVVGLDLIMNNFHLVGRLLDCLQKMEKTTDIPAVLLRAITAHKEYGKYFLSDSIGELIENVQNGESTYEELLASVKALYNIVNQIVPTT